MNCVCQLTDVVDSQRVVGTLHFAPLAPDGGVRVRGTVHVANAATQRTTLAIVFCNGIVLPLANAHAPMCVVDCVLRRAHLQELVGERVLLSSAALRLAASQQHTLAHGVIGYSTAPLPAPLSLRPRS